MELYGGGGGGVVREGGEERGLTHPLTSSLNKEAILPAKCLRSWPLLEGI